MMMNSWDSMNPSTHSHSQCKLEPPSQKLKSSNHSWHGAPWSNMAHIRKYHSTCPGLPWPHTPEPHETMVPLVESKLASWDGCNWHHVFFSTRHKWKNLCAGLLGVVIPFYKCIWDVYREQGSTNTQRFCPQRRGTTSIAKWQLAYATMGYQLAQMHVGLALSNRIYWTAPSTTKPCGIVCGKWLKHNSQILHQHTGAPKSTWL